VLVIALCDHELFHRIENQFRAGLKWEVRRRRMRRPARQRRALPGGIREPALIDKTNLPMTPEKFRGRRLNAKTKREGVNEKPMAGVNVRPLGDRVLVQPIEEEEVKKGGIIIPDTAKEKPQEGKVVALGTGKVN
jgi:hypothetical protein